MTDLVCVADSQVVTMGTMSDDEFRWDIGYWLFIFDIDDMFSFDPVFFNPEFSVTVQAFDGHI